MDKTGKINGFHAAPSLRHGLHIITQVSCWLSIPCDRGKDGGKDKE